MVDFVFSQNNVTDEYKNIYNSVEKKPSVSDALKQDKVIEKLKRVGIWQKTDLFSILSSDSEDIALTNWKNVNNKFSKVGNPVFEKYLGYRSSPNNYIDTNFNPFLVNPNVSDFSFIACSSDYYSSDAGYLAGAKDKITSDHLLVRPRATAATCEMFTNKSTAINPGNGSNTEALINGTKGYFGFTSYENRYIVHKRVSDNVIAGQATQNKVVDNNIIIGGYIKGATANIGTCRCSFIFIGRGLNPLEVNTLIEIIEDYQYSVGSPIYNYNVSYDSKTKISVSTFLNTHDSLYPYNTEVIHPSVKYFNEKVHGSHWWQANTPYPLSDGSCELPSVFISDDGVDWVPSSPSSSPIFPYDGSHWYSDTELHYEDNEFVLFFRNVKFPPDFESKISYITSTDGKTWDKDNISVVFEDELALTPSIINNGNEYRMYYLASGNVIKYCTSQTLKGVYSNSQAINSSRSYSTLFHISALFYNGFYYIALGRGDGIYILKSPDGINFNEHQQTPTIARSIEWEFENDKYYRPCFCIENGNVWIYYSMRAPEDQLGSNYCGRQLVHL